DVYKRQARDWGQGGLGERVRGRTAVRPYLLFLPYHTILLQTASVRAGLCRISVRSKVCW
ncbi:hypothetical protein, partial [Chroococcidiopsis sp. CCALA 051]|uniref:hypothetical protein n=1 Tax=Chroococcidiopsis sp. CCALA 051 TaxID=869949 RepID=UPI001E5E7ADA